MSERKLSQSNEILDSANSESEVDGVENRLESSPYPSRSSSFHSGQIMMSTSATQLDASQGQGFAKKVCSFSVILGSRYEILVLPSGLKF